MTSDIPATTLLDPAVIDDPYPFYRRLHEAAPVWLVPGTEVCVVGSFAAVVEATGRIDDFSSSMHHFLYRDDEGLPARLPFGDGTQVLAVADPPVHKVHRQAVFPDLMARRMAGLEPEITGVTDRCLDDALAQRRVDFMSAVGNVVPITMITHLIGFRDHDLASLLQAAFDSTAQVGARVTLDELNALLVESAKTYGWIAEQLTAYGADAEHEILGTIARAVRDGAMDESDAVIVLQTLLSAGGESTTSLLGNSVRILAERPELQQHLRARPGLVATFVEEVLRLESPFRFLPRHTPHATHLAGVDLPAATTVLLMWGAANRDPAEFDAPDDLRLDRRTPRHHLAFGRGIHHCVGAPLARIEARVVLTTLLARSTSFRLDPDRTPRWFDSLQVRRHEHLPIVIDAR
ncbi:MAG TPA: cytochrome P450 [Acidimicrobiales bacterium]|nr:cytochrome P450 [Acidimicrobiales bacterium]